MRTASARLACLLVPLLVSVWTGCGLDASEPQWAQAARLTGGDPRAGREHMREYGCGACHTIPGVAGADSRVGPPLVGLSGRMYIAGVLPNEPGNLVRWIQNPPAISPRTAMPALGVGEQEARDIAAYLYGLE